MKKFKLLIDLSLISGILIFSGWANNQVKQKTNQNKTIRKKEIVKTQKEKIYKIKATGSTKEGAKNNAIRKAIKKHKEVCQFGDIKTSNISTGKTFVNSFDKDGKLISSKEKYIFSFDFKCSKSK